MTVDPATRSQVLARFVLTGDELDPDAVSLRLQVGPTNAWRKGDAIEGRGAVRRRSGAWMLEASDHETASLAQQLTGITDILTTDWPALIELVHTYEARFDVIVYLRSPTGPDLSLPAAWLRRIGPLGADVDLDLYCLATPEADGQE